MTPGRSREELVALVDGWMISAAVGHSVKGETRASISVRGPGGDSVRYWTLPESRQWALELYQASIEANSPSELAQALTQAIRRAQILAQEVQHQKPGDAWPSPEM